MALGSELVSTKFTGKHSLNVEFVELRIIIMLQVVILFGSFKHSPGTYTNILHVAK